MFLSGLTPYGCGFSSDYLFITCASGCWRHICSNFDITIFACPETIIALTICSIFLFLSYLALFIPQAADMGIPIPFVPIAFTDDNPCHVKIVGPCLAIPVVVILAVWLAIRILQLYLTLLRWYAGLLRFSVAAVQLTEAPGMLEPSLTLKHLGLSSSWSILWGEALQCCLIKHITIL
jgi:hypothetical protein